ncbi:Smr/MutS family protein [Methylobacterium radiodurans]|uniref:DNA mismatch repair protein MutS n=1 Tax=Methylobacterium radiodurans TaxID=2202828 RepID=A0A2U8VN07_9HYPH|nr:Smr/MutS family protein [Methylobacterium radiodurans]AWN34977.1 DNA mismatch repair protein MutS [Methylobacterium radiodurans]
MRRPRRSPTLTGEEARLWAEIAKLITPLRGRGRPKAEPAAKMEPAKPSVGTAAKSAAKSSVRMPVPPTAGALAREFAEELAATAPAKRPARAATVKVSKAPTVPRDPAPGASPAKPAPRPPSAAPYQAPPQAPRPPAGLDRQARLALRRGTLAVEARIDLHGMIQSEAHAALTGFLMRARAAGHAHVLVVTGKGGEGFADPFSERGVLRRSVPHWLRGPDLRGLVLGFEEAARHHGGGGALYVRLRRR